MRTLLHTLSRSLSLGVLVAAGAAAPLAQSAPQGQSEESSSVRIQGVQPMRYKLSPTEFADFKGRYLMSNGSGLTVHGNNRRAFAELDGRAPVELVPTSHNSFVSRSGDLELKFDEWYENRNTDVVMRMRVGSDMVAIASR